MSVNLDVDKNLILLNQNAATSQQAIRIAGQVLVDNGYVEEPYIDSMLKRNQDVSVYMGNFIAIPHGTDDGKKYIKKTGISVIQFPFGVDFSNDPNEEKLVTIVFGIAGLNGEHLELLQKIAIFCSDLNNVVKLADAQSKEEVVKLLGGVQ